MWIVQNENVATFTGRTPADRSHQAIPALRVRETILPILRLVDANRPAVKPWTLDQGPRRRRVSRCQVCRVARSEESFGRVVKPTPRRKQHGHNRAFEMARGHRD